MREPAPRAAPPTVRPGLEAAATAGGRRGAAKGRRSRAHSASSSFTSACRRSSSRSFGMTIRKRFAAYAAFSHSASSLGSLCAAQSGSLVALWA